MWRQIEGSDCVISSTGIIKRNKKILNGHKTHNGYTEVWIPDLKKQCRVHILVAKTFPEICGEWFDGCDVHHINHDKTDNRAENLKVLSKKEHYLIHKGNKGERKVEQWSKDGTLIKVWDSMADAERALNLPLWKSSIRKIVRGLNRLKSCYGFVWKYNE